MKNFNISIILSLLIVSLTFAQSSKSTFFKSVHVDTLLKDKISIRAILISDGKVYYAGDQNRIGYIDLINKDKFERKINKDSIKMEFRSIANNTTSIFVATIGNPAFIYQFSKDLNLKKLVYEEHNDKVFYDCLQFWNDQEGIAIGDPISDCFSILITRNSGSTWTKVDCKNLPKMEDGEVAFSASNTNIIIKGSKTWIVSGGKKARVFYSPDKGISWQVFNTPIIQGETMTGIFTADFYNDKIGIIAGGNYEKPNQNFKNKALTVDGGKTWKLIADNAEFGYASCIQFVPNSNEKQLVCVGANGLYYSKNRGKTWQQLLTDSTLYTIRFINSTTAIAAGKNKIIKISFD
ncbi:MAG: oxidoreductase [Flavobacterium sp.]|nr:oxidoreductase [Flavobacterium sp.]